MEVGSFKPMVGKALREHGFTAIICLQATFLIPYVVLVPGERTNVFTSLLTLLPLIQYTVYRGEEGWTAPVSWTRALAWAVLAGGFALSAALSSTPLSSGLRALSFLAPAAGGLICGYAFFRTPEARTYLFGLLTVCFAGLTLSHLVLGAAPSFMGLWHHALAGTLVLLAAGPIHMAASGGGLRRAIAVLLLILGGVVCFLAGSRFVILLPFALIPVYVLFKSLTLRTAGLVLVASAIVAGVFFTVFPAKVLRTVNYESTYYRVEAFPATWVIVQENWLLGIGIRTPRTDYLENYTPASGLVSREQFLAVLDRNVTWDNQYLSLLCGVGVPLTLLYLYLAGQPLAGYLRRAWRGEVDAPTERALTFALLASVIHFAVHDGLYYPQINWFFHLLLGVGAYSGSRSGPVPTGEPAPAATPVRPGGAAG